MAEGSYAVATNVDVAIPTTSWATLDLGAVSVDADSILSASAGVYTPQDEGYYLIVSECRFDSTHNNRVNIMHRVSRNGSEVPGSRGTGYARNVGNRYLWVRAFTVAHFDGSSDSFTIDDIRDVGSGGPAGVYDVMTLKVVQLTAGGTSSAPFSRYTDPSSGGGLFGGAGGPSAASVVSGWTASTETDTSVIEMNSLADGFDLKGADRPYLVLYSMPENRVGGSARTTRVADLTVNGDRVPVSAGYGYMRDANNEFAAPNGMALIKPSSAVQVAARVWGYDNTLATLWGSWTAGSWRLDGAEAAVTVIALPAGTDVAIFDDEAADQQYATTAVLDLTFAETEVVADGVFSRAGAQSVDVTGATDVFGYAAYMIERTVSSGTRQSNAMRFEVEGTDLTSTTQFGSYLRGEQGTQDCKNSATGVTLLGSLSAGDTIQVEKFDPGSNSGASNDYTSWGGSFFIDLETLAPRVQPLVIAGAEVSVEWVVAPGVVAGSGGSVAGPVVAVEVATVPGPISGAAPPPIVQAGPSIEAELSVGPGPMVGGVGVVSGPSFGVEVEVVGRSLVGSPGVGVGPSIPVEVSVVGGTVAGSGGVVAGPVVAARLSIGGVFVGSGGVVTGPAVGVEVEIAPGLIVGAGPVVAAADVLLDVVVAPGPVSGLPAGVVAPALGVEVEVQPGPLVGEAVGQAGPVLLAAVEVLPGVIAGSSPVEIGPSFGLSLLVSPGEIKGAPVAEGPVVALGAGVVAGSLSGGGGVIAGLDVGVEVEVVPGVLIPEASPMSGPEFDVAVRVEPGPLVAEPGLVQAGPVEAVVVVVGGPVSGEASALPGPVVSVVVAVVPGGIDSASSVAGPVVSATVEVVPGVLAGSPVSVKGPGLLLELSLLTPGGRGFPAFIDPPFIDVALELSTGTVKTLNAGVLCAGFRLAGLITAARFAEADAGRRQPETETDSSAWSVKPSRRAATLEAGSTDYGCL